MMFDLGCLAVFSVILAAASIAWRLFGDDDGRPW